jgi:hypothetical protein
MKELMRKLSVCTGMCAVALGFDLRVLSQPQYCVAHSKTLLPVPTALLKMSTVESKSHKLTVFPQNKLKTQS